MEKLDATGLMRPTPVLRARRKLQEMKAGDVLEVRADDPDAVRDVPVFCQQAGHHLLMVREDAGGIVFEIRKGDRPAGALEAAE